MCRAWVVLARAGAAGNDWRWLRLPAAFAVLAVGFAVVTTEPWPHGLGLERCTDTVNPALQNDAGARPQMLETCEPHGAGSAPVLLAMVAALLLLAPEFSEFSVAGLVTVKRSIKQLAEQQDQLKEDQEGVMSRAAYAEAVSKNAAAGLAEPVTPPVETASDRLRWTRQPTVDALAEEYNEVRATMKSGDARTSRMTRIVTALEAATNTDDFDVEGYLRSNDSGKRLAAYAALYARPDPAHLSALVDALGREGGCEGKPFGEYWALRAIGQAVSAYPEAVDPQLLRRLETHDVQPGTDRAYEHTRVLRAARGQA
jgi:hypothetical protein